MTTYIKLSTLEYPRHIGDIKLDPAGIDDYALVEWVDSPTINPELERVHIGTPVNVGGSWLTNWVVTALTPEEKLARVQKNRAAEYPPMADYLDGIVKSNQAQVQTYIDACLAVKAKYPKPV
jgi:hypothetical protein